MRACFRVSSAEGGEHAYEHAHEDEQEDEHEHRCVQAAGAIMLSYRSSASSIPGLLRRGIEGAQETGDRGCTASV